MPGWWLFSRESSKFTGGHAGGQSAGNHANLQDSLIKGHAGGLSARNHVNLQDTYWKVKPTVD